MTKPAISVIIPVFNSMKHLNACLDSVVAAMEHFGNCELILIDNGSTDGSYQVLLSQYGDMARVYQLKGVTISALRNHGARAAGGEYLSFIDSDCVIPKDYFSRAMEVFASVDTDATGCYCALPPSPRWLEETWDVINRLPVSAYVSYLWGANFIVRRGPFEKIGGFDEGLVTDEDTELGLRLNASGFRIFASPQVPAIHLGNPKTLAEFFRKHTWRALGMFATFKLSWRDKPAWATLGHMLLTALGVFSLVVPWASLSVRACLLVLLSMAVPAMAVLYRMALMGRIYRPLGSLMLYYVYFTARAWAAAKLLILAIGRRLGAQDSHPSA